jgi:hypothetical protein
MGGKEPKRIHGESAMKAKIKKQRLEAEFYISEKCFITELSNSADDPDVSIARARVEPGVTARWHRLKGISERYYSQREGARGSWRFNPAGSESGGRRADSSDVPAAHYKLRY